MGVYNGLPRLERAIRSIQDQTVQDFEFLIIDDGSTDGSDRVIRRLADADPRIRFIAGGTNRGLGAVLNRGVEEARGKLVARMDADDISVPRASGEAAAILPDASAHRRPRQLRIGRYDGRGTSARKACPDYA